jgi:hypothetical protein
LPLRSKAYVWLLRKEWHELVASRAWWVMLILIGPLVGVSFISAVRTYAELSGLGGTAAGVGEAFAPLVGVWAPTFSACELAAAFLLPFVAIRLVGGDKQNGALVLELQHPISPLARIAAKSLVLTAGWTIASVPPLIAILMWRAYGGTIFIPELLTVAAGHLLNAGLTIALGAATAALTEHPSTAAIVTLAVTVGTWIINFVAAIHGGIWQTLAGYTPTAMVAEFQHGLVRLDVVLIASTLIAFGLGLAAIWTRIGVTVTRRASESLALAGMVTALAFASTFLTASWDTSEDRANSFPVSAEETLQMIGQQLRIEAHLAPEDPRRADLEHRALSKLRRVLPRTQIDYVSATSTGLFEQTAPHYGEIWYELGGRRKMSRVTTAEGVLETIYDLAGVSSPIELSEDVFRGHPLAVSPRGAATVFYGIWPASVAAVALFIRRRNA